VEGKQATKFEVSVRFGKYWKIVFSNFIESEDSEGAGGTQVDFEMNSMTYSGIKIVMVDGPGRENDAGE
jgi:hypothetical protein